MKFPYFLILKNHHQKSCFLLWKYCKIQGIVPYPVGSPPVDSPVRGTPCVRPLCIVLPRRPPPPPPEIPLTIPRGLSMGFYNILIGFICGGYFFLAKAYHLHNLQWYSVLRSTFFKSDFRCAIYNCIRILSVVAREDALFFLS